MLVIKEVINSFLPKVGVWNIFAIKRMNLWVCEVDEAFPVTCHPTCGKKDTSWYQTSHSLYYRTWDLAQPTLCLCHFSDSQFAPMSAKAEPEEVHNEYWMKLISQRYLCAKGWAWKVLSLALNQGGQFSISWVGDLFSVLTSLVRRKCDKTRCLL